MNDLTGKTIVINKSKYYVYCQLMFNREYYILVLKEDSLVKNGTNIYKVKIESDKYYVSEDIDKKVISKFVVFLSM